MCTNIGIYESQQDENVIVIIILMKKNLNATHVHLQLDKFHICSLLTKRRENYDQIS